MTEVTAKKSKCSRFNELNAAELALRTGMDRVRDKRLARADFE